jgi:hypothetical protein
MLNVSEGSAEDLLCADIFNQANNMGNTALFVSVNILYSFLQ